MQTHHDTLSRSISNQDQIILEVEYFQVFGISLLPLNKHTLTKNTQGI